MTSGRIRFPGQSPEELQNALVNLMRLTRGGGTVVSSQNRNAERLFATNKNAIAQQAGRIDRTDTEVDRIGQDLVSTQNNVRELESLAETLSDTTDSLEFRVSVLESLVSSISFNWGPTIADLEFQVEEIALDLHAVVRSP